jgi:hypothetical protein
MPNNIRPVQPFTPERHLDLQADLHFFFDLLIRGKTVLDVGAGLGRSKARLRHNTVTTYEPSEVCSRLVDRSTPPHGEVYQVVTAFEVLEHVEDDRRFLDLLDRWASEAVFFTTPNWAIAQCISENHYREYLFDELLSLVRMQWPSELISWFAYRKDGEGGWVEPLFAAQIDLALKFVVLVDKNLSARDRQRVMALESL